MSLAFQVFLMWVLYYAGYAPFKLTLGFTIVMGVALILDAINKVIEKRNDDS